MKHNLLIAAAFLFGNTAIHAQQIEYEKSLERAQAAAAKQQKPLAILITIDPPVTTADFGKGLKDAAVISKFNTAFINYKVPKNDTAITGSLIRDFKIFRFPAFIFLDAKGGLLFSDIAFVSRPELLLAMADKAIAASKEMSLIDYAQAHASGDSGRSFLKKYITKRQQAGLNENADLIEKYVNSLNITDLNSYDEVLFILKAGPVAEGRAYKLANTNKNITDSIFKTQPLAERVAMNNNTINNTMKKAIAAKDIKLAYAAANFTRGTWSSDPATGQKNWQLKIIQFYKGIKDTANYLLQAASYHDRYYMQISVDSILKKDSLKYEMAKNNAMQKAAIDKVNDSTIRKTFTVAYPKNNITAGELNSAAWSFYSMATGNEAYLLKAMSWSKRAVEMEPLPAYYDTYAHLLYRLRIYEEAEAMQKKAIEVSGGSKESSATYKAEYEKMKKRKL